MLIKLTTGGAFKLPTHATRSEYFKGRLKSLKELEKMLPYIYKGKNYFTNLIL